MWEHFLLRGHVLFFKYFMASFFYHVVNFIILEDLAGFTKLGLFIIRLIFSYVNFTDAYQ
jgi:hypothetical protein